MGWRPFLFWNSANSICPTSSCSTAPGSWTETTPSEDTFISWASSGITTSGWIIKPLEVVKAPSLFLEKANSKLLCISL